MCRLLLLIALFLCMFDVSHAGEKLNPRPAFSVFVMASQLLPLAYSGGATAGIECSLSKKIAVTAEGGGFYGPGFMAKLNVKYYLPGISVGKKSETVSYLALEYAYKKQRYTASDNLRDSSNNAGKDIDYSVYKFANTLTAKIGLLSSHHGRKRQSPFYFDYFMGLGIRYVVRQNDLTDATIANLYHWHEGFIDAATNSNYAGFAPTISFGLKVGYRLKRISSLLK